MEFIRAVAGFTLFDFNRNMKQIKKIISDGRPSTSTEASPCTQFKNV
jgi:hypothetical protein